MISVSTKFLRNNLANVIDKIQTGETVLLIHKSIPVAELTKPQHVIPLEASDNDINLSATQDLSSEFLSEKEMNYYLSLK